MYSVYRLIYTVAWLNGMKSMCGVDAVDRVDGVDRVDVDGVGIGVDFLGRVFWDGWLNF